MRQLSSAVTYETAQEAYKELQRVLGHEEFHLNLAPYVTSINRFAERFECNLLDAYYGCCFKLRFLGALTSEKMNWLKSALLEMTDKDLETLQKEIKWSQRTDVIPAYLIKEVRQKEEEHVTMPQLDPLKPVVDGKCNECGAAITAKDLALVTEWETNGWHATPKVLHCRACAAGVEGVSNRKKRKVKIVKEKPNKMSVIDVARALLGAMSKTEAHGSKWIAKKAGVSTDEYPVRAILEKLMDAGKVALEDGKWTKA